MYSRTCLSLLAVTFIVAPFAGCAASYDDYTCGCPCYRYAPAPPLPYTHYRACPTPIAECYAAEQAPPGEPVR